METPTIVFDIDGVLGIGLSEDSKAIDLSLMTQRYGSKYQPSVLWDTDGKAYSYLVLADWKGALVTIIRDWGWRVCFFSAADESRNVPLIAGLLSALFPDSYESWKEKGNFSVFSDHHTSPSRYFIQLPKKSLTKISVMLQPPATLSNMILVDDCPDYVDSAETPFIDVSAFDMMPLRDDLSDWQKDPAKRQREQSECPAGSWLALPAYVLGLLENCRSSMIEHKLTLRKALERVLAETKGKDADRVRQAWIAMGEGLVSSFQSIAQGKSEAAPFCNAAVQVRLNKYVQRWRIIG